MKSTELISITVNLTCDDVGLNNDKIAAGYALEIVKMHHDKYVKVDPSGENTVERVKIHSMKTCVKGTCLDYVDF